MLGDRRLVDAMFVLLHIGLVRRTLRSRNDLRTDPSVGLAIRDLVLDRLHVATEDLDVVLR